MKKSKEVTYNIEKWDLNNNTRIKLGKGFTEAEMKEVVRGYDHDMQSEAIDDSHAYFYRPDSKWFFVVGRDDRKDFYDLGV